MKKCYHTFTVVKLWKTLFINAKIANSLLLNFYEKIRNKYKYQYFYINFSNIWITWGNYIKYGFPNPNFNNPDLQSSHLVKNEKMLN